MINKKILFIIFALVAAVQLYVPASIIINSERILTDGKEFKFKTAPVDPSDPFRGKYITLDFAANAIKVNNKEEWMYGEAVFVWLSKDKEGFVKIDTVTKNEPQGKSDFVKARVNYISDDNTLQIDYPFDRYYMEESKAGAAEDVYRESSRDTSHFTYALINVKNGEAVLKDVLIDNVSIREIVKKQNGQ
jgi:uncharacterized membrane-anchored protein